MSTGLPPGWQTVRLAEVLAEPLASGRPVHSGKGGVPVLRPTALRTGTVDFDDVRSTRSAPEADTTGLIDPGDLLISRVSGTLSRVGEGALAAKHSRPVAFPGFMTRVRALSSAVDLQYLVGLWNSPIVRTQLEDRARLIAGRTHQLTQADLEEIQLPLPSTAEQRRILTLLAAFYTRIDKAVIRTRTAVGQATELSELITARAGLLAGRALLPADLPPDIVDDGFLPLLPEGWRWTRLGSIADVARGVAVGNARKWDGADVEVPLLRVLNVQRGRLALDDVTTTRLPQERAFASQLRPADVLLTATGDRTNLGRGWIWEGQLADCVHQNHVFRIRIHDRRLHPKLLAWHANSFGQGWCERNARQSTGPASIGLGTIRLMPVPVGPPAEQDRVVRLVEERKARIDSAVTSAERVLTTADQLRHAVQRRAFTGGLANYGGAFEHEEMLP